MLQPFFFLIFIFHDEFSVEQPHHVIVQKSADLAKIEEFRRPVVVVATASLCVSRIQMQDSREVKKVWLKLSLLSWEMCC